MNFHTFIHRNSDSDYKYSFIFWGGGYVQLIQFQKSRPEVFFNTPESSETVNDLIFFFRGDRGSYSVAMGS